MAEIISDYSELLAAVAALPEPPAGTVRVYRGQTKDYELLPSGVRGPLRLMSIWSVYATHLYSELEPTLNAGDLSEPGLQVHWLWFKALAQQYGPGSDFLDVSHSIDIALWFALNKATKIQAVGTVEGDGATVDHQISELVGYEPLEKEGFIYVLDLPLWNGKGLPHAGEIVDLATAPEVFASSPRMRAQLGCLIYCRNTDGKPFNARKLLVAGTPLRVRRPMAGTDVHDRSVADIYPSPAQDEWFARLLSVPMTYAAPPEPLTLQRSIPVVVYHDSGNRNYQKEVHFHDVAIRPRLVHRVIPELRTQSPAGAPPPTIIMLEAPMIFPYAPANSGLWHHGLLSTDVPERCPEYQFGLEKPVGEVSLASVFFEFSLLEGIGWERVIRDKMTIDLHRAVWLRRAGDTFEVAVLNQSTPRGAVKPVGFYSMFYDASLGRLMVSLPGSKQAPVPIDTLEGLAKPIMVALMLLRNLSPTLKYQPFPSVALEGKALTVRCASDAARLYRVRPGPPNPDWFVLRDASEPERPFTAVRRRGGARIETTLPFRDYPLSELQKSLPVPTG
jgi:FRG domain